MPEGEDIDWKIEPMPWRPCFPQCDRESLTPARGEQHTRFPLDHSNLPHLNLIFHIPTAHLFFGRSTTCYPLFFDPESWLPVLCCAFPPLFPPPLILLSVPLAEPPPELPPVDRSPADWARAENPLEDISPPPFAYRVS